MNRYFLIGIVCLTFFVTTPTFAQEDVCGPGMVFEDGICNPDGAVLTHFVGSDALIPPFLPIPILVIIAIVVIAYLVKRREEN